MISPYKISVQSASGFNEYVKPNGDKEYSTGYVSKSNDSPIAQNPFSTSTSGAENEIFFTHNKSSSYLFDPIAVTSEVGEGNVCIPLQVDTEFTTEKKWTELAQCGRLGITTQVKGILPNSKEMIFSHPEVSHLITRHPVAASDFHPVNYIQSLGHICQLETFDSLVAVKGLPVAHVILYAHFAVAEAMMITRGQCAEDFKHLFSQKDETRKFEMRRRLQASSTIKTNKGKMTQNYVDLAWKLTIDGVAFAVRLTWIDTCAIHGIASYKDVCEASGVKLDSKDNFNSDEKADMLTMAIERPEDFDSYALGDLKVYDALAGNAQNMKQVYKAQGLEEFAVEPSLTIGATVKKLFQASLMKHLGFEAGSKDWDAFEKEYITPSSAQALRTDSKRTSAMLAKIVGGRCRNNRPTTVSLNGLICDLDISGAYGEGQRNQTYPIGKPEILDYPADSKVNEYWTVKEFRKAYKSDLESGVWFAIVSFEGFLKYRQDFLASWYSNGQTGADIMAKYVAKMSTDTESQAFEDDASFDEEDGNLKIFNHEVHNSVITHEFLQWLDNVCSAQQRKELEEGLRVKAAMVYPASQRCKSHEAFLEAQEVHSAKNTVKRVQKGGRRSLRRDDGECHAWYGVNLGDLVINNLLANRKLYAKKTPLNTLYKLCINTLYGDMTSKYFTTANTVVGNNITARCRALAWYMEKGLYGFQTVTDGCAFELNRVVFPKGDRRVTAVELTNFYQNFKQSNVAVAALSGSLTTNPLGAVERIDHEWIKGDKGYEIRLTLNHKSGEKTIYQGSEAMDWVNRAAMEHLQNLFPGVDVLHAPSTALKPFKNENGTAGYDLIPQLGQFAFEAKDYYDSIICHGASNYRLTNPNGTNLKMRSYETKKPHDSAALDGDNLTQSDRYDSKNNPAVDLFNQLENPSAVQRQEPFVKTAILKPGDYANRLEVWDSLDLVPGDNFNKPGLLRECSLSQFTFQTLEQYVSWDKLIFKNKDKYGQSLEQFFLNDDGTLDFTKMVTTIDRLIGEGCLDPFESLDPDRNGVKLGKRAMYHSKAKVYEALKAYLKTPKTED